MAIDEHSRTDYTEELDDERGIVAAAFLERACESFALAGVAIQRVLTDNGAYYKQ